MHFVMQTIDFHDDRNIGTLLAEPWRDGCVGTRLDNGNATMGNAINVVAISGGLQRPSRTLALTDAIVAALGAALPIDTRLIELGEIGGRLAGALTRAQVPDDLEAQIRAIETADALVVASPVYRASYTGLFKHLFDLVRHDALVDVPVLLAATGGSERHALVIDHQLRPLFSFFQARTLPIGVYASESDFDRYEIANPALRARIALAVDRAVPQLRPHALSAAAA
ncbi:FMN reductase [Burkholderia stabilis]|uniref:FMN reductase n=2 Tax=Burkholderia stabilis TaxID=95485 RepID=A0A1Y1BZV7_9BURK|nr:FMN reductase [Burkholderia stabilis]